jgi:hypothetical protein
MSKKCNCHDCNGVCHRPSDADIETNIELQIIAEDVRVAIAHCDEPIALWGFLTQYLAEKGVFQ